tara:strand:- start:2076 stop:2249 length:174 start_codon:yes stop_codon:yes gene_type:complete
MKLILTLLFFFITSCSNNSFNDEKKIDINFNNEMTFNDYKAKLDEYAEQGYYPNIDN